jgi:hypothetical protein
MKMSSKDSGHEKLTYRLSLVVFLGVSAGQKAHISDDDCALPESLYQLLVSLGGGKYGGTEFNCSTSNPAERFSDYYQICPDRRIYAVSNRRRHLGLQHSV